MNKDATYIPDYYPGEAFVYVNDESWEVGVVKSRRDAYTYFCWYSSGDTAAATPVFNMHKLVNGTFPPFNHVGGAK